MKVAITGGRGFLGKFAVDALRAAGHVPVKLTRSAPGAQLANYLDVNALALSFQGFDAVWHLAGIAHTRGNPDAYHREIVELTRCVWDAARRAGVRQFLFASSTKVYGERSHAAPFDESSDCHPVSPYGTAKLHAERYLMRASRDSAAPRLTIFRFPPMFGQGMKGSVRWLFAAGTRGVPLPIGGLAPRHYLYAGNAAAAMVAAAEGRLQRELYLPHEPQALPPADVYARVFSRVRKTAPGNRILPFPKFLTAMIEGIPAFSPLVRPFLLRSAHEAELTACFQTETAAAIHASICETDPRKESSHVDQVPSGS